MKILLVNKYLYPKGGAEKSTLLTGELLRDKGHEVIYWGMSHPKNPEYQTASYFTDGIDYSNTGGLRRQIEIAHKLLYSFEAKDKIEKLIKAEKPDIVHLNNFAHEISPSILDVFKKYGIPMVMTLRDSKLVCPTYLMLSKGKPCEKCRNGNYYWCLFRKCTKDSYVKSLLNVLEMYLHHKILHIYDKIAIFISPSLFLKDKVTYMGLKGELIQLPNFIDSNDYDPSYSWDGNNIVYLGRLSQEKGVFTLIEAVEGLDVQLNIIGDGPQRGELEDKVKEKGMKNVHFLGFKNGEGLYDLIRKSMFVIVPSEVNENYSRAIVEAFTLGKPVIASRIGGNPELAKDNETGMLFTLGDKDDLREKILELLSEPDSIVSMGRNARKFIERELNPDRHYEKLMKIYNKAIEKSETN
jgi:glycosyltransferase involved in cell wall biosynthesis